MKRAHLLSINRIDSIQMDEKKLKKKTKQKLLKESYAEGGIIWSEKQNGCHKITLKLDLIE